MWFENLSGILASKNHSRSFNYWSRRSAGFLGRRETKSQSANRIRPAGADRTTLWIHV